MTPAERREISRAAIVWDLDDAPPELLDIVEILATQFDDLPRLIVGRDDY